MSQQVVLFKVSELQPTAAAAINITEALLLQKDVVGPLTLAAKHVQSVGGMCVDYSGNIYVSDDEQHVIVKIGEGGDCHILAGKAGTSGSNTAKQNVAPADARFNTPKGLACDKSGNIYVADYGNNQIRIIRQNGTTGLYAGNGSGTSGLVDSTLDATQSQFSYPIDVAVDNSGTVYVADYGNNAIRKIWGGTVLTIAGGTSSADASNVRASKYIPFCNGPTSIAVDARGTLWITDSNNHKVKKISQKGWVYHVSGSGATGHSIASGAQVPQTSCTYEVLTAIRCDRNGYLYVLDKDTSTKWSRLLKLTPLGTPSVIIDFHETTNSYAGLQGLAVSPAQKVFVSLTTADEKVSSSSLSSSHH